MCVNRSSTICEDGDGDEKKIEEKRWRLILLKGVFCGQNEN